MNCANWLGSFLFRGKFKSLEYLTERLESSLKMEAITQAYPYTGEGRE